MVGGAQIGATTLGAGGAPRPYPQEPDGSLGIRGGVGGITFQFEELLQGASALESVADDLRAVEFEAGHIRDELERHQADCPSTGYGAWTASAECFGDVAAVRQQLQRIAADVRSTYLDYESAEAWASMAQRTGLPLPALTGWLEVIKGTGSSGPVGLRDVVESAVDRAPRNMLMQCLGPAVAGAAGALVGPTDTRGTVRYLSGLPGLEFLRPRPIQAFAQPAETREVDLTLPGILHELEEVSADPGEIEVIRVDQEGGHVFLVLIPGTQPGQPTGGGNPLDEAGIADGLGYDSQETAKAIREALREAGATAGDRVVAAGHSQGGIHAMNLSRDKAFLSEFDLKFVVTAGSPVGAITPEPGIGSLHLEHVNDFVPALEGRPNPDTKDRVTVTLSDAAELRPGEDPGLGAAHKLRVYEAGAQHIVASEAPSLLASTGTLAGLVGAGGAAAVTRVKLTRTPGPAAGATGAPPIRPLQSGVSPLAETVVPRAMPDVAPRRAMPDVAPRQAMPDAAPHSALAPPAR